MPPVRTARKRTARQLSQDPTHLLEFILGRNMGKSSTTRPEDRDFALEENSDGGARIGDSEDDVPTVTTFSETIILRSHELLDLVGQRHQAEAQRFRKGRHVDRAGFDRCWTAFVNAASERDQAEKRLKGIEENKSARENAIKCEKRQAVRQEHRDTISALEQEKQEIESRLIELNDKVPLLQEKASKRFNPLKALQELEIKKAMKKVGDKSYIIRGLRRLLLLNGVDRIADWGVARRETLLEVIGNDKLNDLASFKEFIRWMHEQQRKQEAMEMDDELAKLEDVEGGEQSRD